MRSETSRFMMPVAFVVCLSVMLFAGCPERTPEVVDPGPPMIDGGIQPSGEPIKIGAIFSVTGSGAPLGEPEKLTAEMMEKQINDAGGISGRPVKIIIEDDESEESKAVLAARKLIETDKVVAIVGPTLSGTTLAIMDTCQKAEIPLFSCAASIKITHPVEERKWVFSSAQTDVLAVERIIDYLKAHNITKVAIICDANAFGQSGAEQLKEQLPAAGVTILQEEKFNTNDTQMKAQLTKIKSSNPEAIICWGTNPGPAAVTRDARSLGIDAKLIMSHGVANRTFIELAQDAAEGVVFPAGKLLVANDIPDDEHQKSFLFSSRRRHTR